MRTAVRLTLLCVLLSLLCVPARAQPRQSQPPALDARCKAATHRYISVVSDKKHRTVEQQSRVEYDEGRKYLSVCGGKDERFEAFIRNWVEKYDKAVREFEEKRKAAEPPAKDPAKEQLR